mgnify:CR=1 FL=1
MGKKNRAREETRKQQRKRGGGQGLARRKIYGQNKKTERKALAEEQSKAGAKQKKAKKQSGLIDNLRMSF